VTTLSDALAVTSTAWLAKSIAHSARAVIPVLSP